MIGPPNVGLKSQILLTLFTRGRPSWMSSGVRLFAWKSWFAKFANRFPRNVLPPSFGIVLVSTPLDRLSADSPLVVMVISCTVPVLTTSVVLYPPPVLFMLLYGIPFSTRGIWSERLP